MNTALVLNDGDLSLIKKPIPCVQDANDVVVKVSFCGICGTDLSIIAKEFPAASKVVMGHEFAGTVTEVGSNVRHLNVGDRYRSNILLFIICTSFSYKALTVWDFNHIAFSKPIRKVI